jgi:hypothetical protein
MRWVLKVNLIIPALHDLNELATYIMILTRSYVYPLVKYYALILDYVPPFLFLLNY